MIFVDPRTLFAAGEADSTAADAADGDDVGNDNVLDYIGIGLDDPLLAKGLAVGVAIVLAMILYSLLRRILGAAAKRNRGVAEFEPMFARLLRWLYVPIAIGFVLQQAGVDLGSLWTVVSAGIAMVAIGFVAVWSLLSNVSSTFMIFSTRMYKVGDDVELMEPTAKEGLRGIVLDINVLFTTIEQRDEDGQVSTTRLPNNVFFQKALRVYGRDSAPPPSKLHMPDPDQASIERVES